MLKINTDQTGIHCDGLSRRNFLQIGSLAMGGMALPQLLRAEAEAPSLRRSVMNLSPIAGRGPRGPTAWEERAS